MQQYYSINLISGFIKNLLYNTPLPLVDTANTHTKMVNGGQYLHKLNFIECTQSGTLIDGTAKQKTLQHYIPGKDYVNMTHRFVSTSNYYDNETHRYLGDYLRWYRDIFNIDLMAYYNCFQTYLVDDIQLAPSSPELYKTYLTHIKFNTTYTIAIDSVEPFYYKPVLYTDIGLSELSSRINIDTVCTQSNFGQPFTVEFSTDDLELYNNRKNLYLAISLPIGNTSSITILEGNFTNADVHNIFNVENLQQLDPVHMNGLLISSPTLLRMNIEKSIPFSPRLIEYLLENVIDSRDPISNNIELVQKYIDKKSELFSSYGIWNDNIRYLIYRLCYRLNLSTVDGDGYANKDVEKYLKQGMLTYTIGRILYTGHYKIGYKYDLMQINSSENDQYDIEFVSNTPITNSIDINQNSARKSEATITFNSFAGQNDIVIEGPFISDIVNITIDGHVCNEGYDFTFDTDGVTQYKNIINLKGTYGGRTQGGNIVYDGNLWEQYFGGLRKSTTPNISVTYRYGVNVVIDTSKLEITYYE